MFRLCFTSANSFCLVALVVAALRLCEASPGSSSLALLSRQLAKPDLPSSGESQSCDNQCSVLSTLDDCETDQCFCTDSNSDGLASCLDCLVATGNGTMSQGQTVMNDYIDDCAELGFTVKNETIKASGAGALSIPVAGAAATALLAILWA
ncbi:hypothetical protein F5890DRAFT_1549974 [Lentinula detonsa]|uniref:Extracellular membrane protein CFEM domain-containing protein n=1 Tax=Lentinula detonsa TaxID=2804962 RepID=A0AA38Q7Y8_9AGAR|nr:hypothetical protein F5890DRAFT_1549974 [Lentinula detonsa]